MRRLAIRLAVAFLTFVIGLALAAALTVFRRTEKQQPGSFTLTTTTQTRLSSAETEHTSAPCADVSPATTRLPISGGVLNGKALSLPKPAFPPIARSAHVSGPVAVQITINECGYVTSARALDGHPLLQAAAVQAAQSARFSPTYLSGQPVQVTGVVTYNFQLPD